jgi:hypothetical protein
MRRWINANLSNIRNGNATLSSAIEELPLLASWVIALVSDVRPTV